MDRTITTLLLSIIGLIIGFTIKFIFDLLPEKWLQDYDYDPKSPSFRLSKRMRFFPEALLSALLCATLYGLFAYFCYDYFLNEYYIRIAICLVVVPIISIIAFSDKLNRIIPDQCSLALLLLGLLGLLGDYVEFSPWYSENVKWYIPILNRLIALVIGGGFLLLIEVICQSFLGREGMGQGDIKLLGASGFLVGCYGLVGTIYIGIFTAVFFAVPLLIKKWIRISNENKEIKASANPSKTRREIMKRKADIHFADNPDYLAFGPFLAFGAGMFLCLELPVLDFILPYFTTFGLYF